MDKIKLRYVWKRKTDGHIWLEIVPIERLEGDGPIPFIQLDHSEFELVSRDRSTGLNDKNGKEIYEKDIVKYLSHEGYLLNNFVAEVFWKDVQWSLGNRKNGMQTDINLSEIDELEEDLLSYLVVIGSIYENLDLLK